jgi:hypothetical protein
MTGPAQPGPDMWPESSDIVYENPWMRVREDRFRRRDGSSGTYGVVDKQDFSIVIAEQDAQVHLVEQFRYPIGRRSWEFPMGGWPTGKSGSMLELAQAELQEETGLTAATWTLLGNLHEAPGYCSQGFGVYYATDLRPGDHDREDSEVDMIHGAFTRSQLRSMIIDGTIVDSTTVAAFGLLLLLESSSDDPADRVGAVWAGGRGGSDASAG